MKRVLITGSRDWDDITVIFSALNQIMKRWGTNLIIVHGGARGADSIAAQWGILQGVIVETHPADWETHGKRAGFVRNAEMVKLGADICVAFIKNESKGASMTADLAEKAGIPTLRISGY